MNEWMNKKKKRSTIAGWCRMKKTTLQNVDCRKDERGDPSLLLSFSFLHFTLLSFVLLSVFFSFSPSSSAFGKNHRDHRLFLFLLLSLIGSSVHRFACFQDFINKEELLGEGRGDWQHLPLHSVVVPHTFQQRQYNTYNTYNTSSHTHAYIDIHADIIDIYICVGRQVHMDVWSLRV